MLQLNQNNDPELLLYDELEFVVNTIVESVDIEVTRIKANEKELGVVADHLFSLYRDTNYFNFFTLGHLKYLTEDVFDNEHFRDFMLNLTDRVNASLPYNDKDEDRLIKTVVRSVCRNKTDTDDSLIIREVRDSIYVNPEVLYTCLKANFWLIVIYLLSIHFNKTEVYKTSVKSP